MEIIISIGIGILFGVAIYQMMQRNVIRSAIGIILLSSAINLFLLAAGSSNGLEPAYTAFSGERPDPLPQALVLTAIVISMGGFAFLLAMIYLVSSRFGTSSLDEINNLKH